MRTDILRSMPTAGRWRRIALAVENGSCAHCARKIDRHLRELDGVAWIQIDRVGRQVFVGFDATRISARSIRAAMERSGYPSRLLAEQ